MSERVRIDISEHVATVTMIRGEKHNALDEAMFRDLQEAALEVAADAGVRAVVLHGEGKSFCSGLDIASFMTGEGMGVTDMLEREGGQIANFAQRPSTNWALVPAPVIAAIHGNCLGGGLQIALGADIRIVAPDAKLSVLEARWGLIPDMTGTVMLPKLVGLDVAKELTLTGRMVSGEEAARLGLATRVADDPRAAAFELAADLVTKSPDALREGKRLLNLSGTRPVAEQFADERKTMGSLIGSPNQVEATMAYFEQREPRFT